MPDTPKLVLIGIDSLMPTIVEKLAEKGELPTIASLMKEGCYARAIPFWPCEIGVNWATIATGATPRTHGCAYTVHIPGTSLDEKVSGFPSYICKAEQIWSVAEKAGRRCIIMDYLQSFPLNIKNVIHVGEDGCPSPSRKEISPAQGYVSEEALKDLPAGKYVEAQGHGWLSQIANMYISKVSIKVAENWRSLPKSRLRPLEAEMKIKPGPRTSIREVKTKLFLMMYSRYGEGYDTVSLHPSRDYNEKLCELQVGEWSKWIIHDFILDGHRVRGVFRVKLLRLTPDGKILHLYRTQIYPIEGWSYPPEIAKELFNICGPYLHRPTEQMVVLTGASDLETFVEESEYHA